MLSSSAQARPDLRRLFSCINRVSVTWSFWNGRRNLAVFCVSVFMTDSGSDVSGKACPVRSTRGFLLMKWKNSESRMKPARRSRVLRRTALCRQLQERDCVHIRQRLSFWLWAARNGPAALLAYPESGRQASLPPEPRRRT